MKNISSKLMRYLKGFMLKRMHGMMTCQEFEAFVSDYIEGELSSQQCAQFERHIKLCQECRQYLQAYQRTVEVSRAVFPVPDNPVPDEIPENLIKAILEAKNLN